MIDTLRSDHLPSYGYHRETAPFLARLAEEGIQLQGYAVSSWTRPSVATLLTGLYPQRHRAVDRTDTLPDSAAYLPALLAEQGFDTLGVVTNGNVSSQLGFDRGHREYAEFPGAKARRVSREALERARELEPPYYLYLHYLDPHDPYAPDAPWGGSPEDLEDAPQPGQFLRGELPATDDNVGRMRDLYDALIARADEGVAQLIRGLDELGLLEDTLVVVTADHGEEFGEHGRFAHGHSLFEELVQVPLIFWSPSGLEPYQSNAAFHQVDFLPTALEALGLEPPGDLDGRSLWPEVAHGRLESEARLFHLELEGYDKAALYAPPYKLIRKHEQPQPKYWLYDLERDAKENEPLRGSEELRSRLARELFGEEWGLTAARLENRETELTGEVRDQLEALGYLGAGESPQPGAERESLDLERVLDLRRANRQLLDGWLLRDENGTWSAPRAELVLPVSEGSRRLVVSGRRDDDRRGEIRCRISVGGVTQVFEIEPGPFKAQIELPAKLQNEGLAFVELEIEPSTRIREVAGPVGLHFQGFAIIPE